jgi:hypothetical protein
MKKGDEKNKRKFVKTLAFHKNI